MRGDRPSIPCSGVFTGMATPHARGSTSHRGTSTLRGTGYPACAGIDPPVRYALVPEGGLPRMRGDRPGYLPVNPKMYSATPHARGSTFAEHFVFGIV